MKSRGRPRHPDVLTPREWDVLTLVREGLTNPQIAERLGITMDAVKYHVSEIMGKLGATSREEAAAVVIATYRPWWMGALTLFAPLGRRLRVDLTSIATVVGAPLSVRLLSGSRSSASCCCAWGITATPHRAGSQQQHRLPFNRSPSSSTRRCRPATASSSSTA